MGLPDPLKLSQIRQLAEAVVKDNFLSFSPWEPVPKAEKRFFR